MENTQIENTQEENTQEENTQNTNEVLELKEIKFNTDWMVKEVPPPSEPSEFEKKLLENTLTAEQLIKKEKEEEAKKKEEDEKLNEEEKEKMLKKDLINKIKVVALDRLGYYALSNPSEMTQLEKNKIIKMMDKILKKGKFKKITEEFNTIIQAILIDEKTNYDNLPIMHYK